MSRLLKSIVAAASIGGAALLGVSLSPHRTNIPLERLTLLADHETPVALELKCSPGALYAHRGPIVAGNSPAVVAGNFPDSVVAGNSPAAVSGNVGDIVDKASSPCGRFASVMSGNFPNSIMSGNFPNSVMSGNFPNSVMSGNFPDGPRKGNTAALPQPRLAELAER